MLELENLCCTSSLFLFDSSSQRALAIHYTCLALIKIPVMHNQFMCGGHTMRQVCRLSVQVCRCHKIISFKPNKMTALVCYRLVTETNIRFFFLLVPQNLWICQYFLIKLAERIGLQKSPYAFRACDSDTLLRTINAKFFQITKAIHSLSL